MKPRLGVPSFAMQFSDETQRAQTEGRWTDLGGPASNPHRWVHEQLLRDVDFTLIANVQNQIVPGCDNTGCAQSLAVYMRPSIGVAFKLLRLEPLPFPDS